MATQICVNTGSDNSLLPDDTKPSPEPVLIYHQWCQETFTFIQISCGPIRKQTRQNSTQSVGNISTRSPSTLTFHFWLENTIWISGLRCPTMVVAIPSNLDDNCKRNISFISSSRNCTSISGCKANLHQFWRWSGSTSMPNFRPYLRCILQ